MTKFPGWRLLCVALIVSFGGSFNFGYQLVITNPSQNAFITFLNESFQQHYKNALSNSVAAVSFYFSFAEIFIVYFEFSGHM